MGTTSLDVAKRIVVDYGDAVELSNLKLNKLVYFAQAVNLHTTGRPLFDDPIEAWAYGPVEPLVYNAFRRFGRGRVNVPKDEAIPLPESKNVLDAVMSTYGPLPAFDLVRLTHRGDGAWSRVYKPGENAIIDRDSILASEDGKDGDVMRHSLMEGARMVYEKWPNAMRMLENS